jgi:glycosyltransferase involved in cell wall biosynthesis
MAYPLVSIIMNCYNGEKYLKEALDSIFAQSYKNWELIFWDNASTDKSAELALSYQDNRIKYFKNDTNVNLGEARNQALKNKSGKYLCFLDTDDIWLLEKLSRQVEFMERKDEVILGYTDAYYLMGTERTNKKCSDDYGWFKGDVFGKLIKDNFINLQTVIINTELCKDELYFKKEYKYAEECELFIRLSLIGGFDYIEDPLVYYRVHSGNMSKNTELVFYERKLLLDTFLLEIKRHEINSDKMYSRLYESMIKTYLFYDKIYEAKKNAEYLLKYPSMINILLYCLVRSGFGKILSKIAKM